ncbi:MAG: hypothetical protein JWO53_1288 [Chlamydiia bacterium]|nr:hypothetical protein [Chlamydiia bacterium]
MQRYTPLVIALILCSQKPALFSEESQSPSLLQKKLDVELVEPTYKNGILSTTKGGTIKGSDLFLQARSIQYIKRIEAGQPVHKILAEGNLFFLFKGRAYTGERIEIDADQRSSVIYNGCSTIEPWYVGGEKIELDSDGAGTIHNGYMTTSENNKSDWSIQARTVNLSKDTKMKAKNVSFYYVKMPILWLPAFSSNLKTSSGLPFRLRFRWGGSIGPRIGITYELYHRDHFKANLLFDVLLKRGLGGGVATHYHNPNGKEKLFTYNYVAHDIISDKENKWLRYRFLGQYDNKFLNDDIDFKLTYDKLSDLGMRSDYINTELSSTRIQPTQARFSKGTEDWRSSLNTKIRLNTFQTIKQELPLFQFNSRPFELGASHILLANRFNAGYLAYKYSRQTKRVSNVRDFHSSRVELGQKLYRNFLFNGISFTPHIGYNAISYNNSPQGDARVLAIGKIGAECHTRLIHPLTHGSDALEPYVDYQYYTDPTASPHKHYLFDLQDGWHRVNQLRFGTRNFFTWNTNDDFLRRLYIDLYGRAFFNTPTLPNSIPRVYTDINFKATPYTSYFTNVAWDTKRSNLDHINIGIEKTVTDNAAFTLEYRHRSAFAWRKLDQDNFIIDSFRKESTLRHSQMSDRRDAILAKIFLRLTPTLVVELQTVQGFHRRKHPKYGIYRVDVSTLLRGALKLNLACEKRTGDKGVHLSFDVSLGMDKPHGSKFKRIGQGNYDN